MSSDSAQPLETPEKLPHSSNPSTPKEVTLEVISEVNSEVPQEENQSILTPIPGLEVESHSTTPRNNVNKGNMDRKCDHGDPAVLRVVKKQGRNQGRKFYSCPHYPKDSSCNYFRWEEPDCLPGGYPSILRYRSISMPRGATDYTSANNVDKITEIYDDLPGDADRLWLQSDKEEQYHTATLPDNANNANHNGDSDNVNINANDNNDNNDANNNNNGTESYDDLSNLRPEDVDPAWLQSVIDEEQSRAISSASAVVPEVESANLLTKEQTRAFHSKTYEKWERVPKFTSGQLLDVITNHFMTQEGEEENIDKIRSHREKVLEDLKKAQKEVIALKKELNRSKLEINIEIAQKRLLQYEKDHLEKENRALKKRRQ